MMLSVSLENALHKIPEVWPLPQFIATNPFFDCVGTPFEKLAQNLHTAFGVRSTLGLKYYIEKFQNADITVSDLQESIHGFLKAHGQAENLNQSLEDFLIAKQTQDRLLATHLPPAQPHSPLVSSRYRLEDGMSATAKIRSEMLSWCSAYFDRGISTWPMPHREKGLFNAWRMAKSESCPLFKNQLAHLPDAIDKIIDFHLKKLGINASDEEAYFTAILWQIKGWAGFVKWQNRYPNNPWILHQATPQELIAMWMCYEVDAQMRYQPLPRTKSQNAPTQQDINNWLEQSTTIPGFNLFDVEMIFHRAYEINHEKAYYHHLINSKDKLKKPSTAVQAQWIFCIDTRSEGIRRHIEKHAQHETFGFAGFFGFSFELQNPNLSCRQFQCPGLLSPDELIQVRQAHESLPFIKSVQTAFNESKENLTAPFALFEMTGLKYGLSLLSKTLAPSLARFRNTTPRLELSHSPIKDSEGPGFSVEKAALIAKNMLKTIGLTERFAPVVIITGHRASTTNNPYQASLDCGACGGHGGQANALVAAMVLNHPDVRETLAEDGIVIPKTTTFIAACHNTTTDEIEWLMNDESTQKTKAALHDTLTAALQDLAIEKAQDFITDRDGAHRGACWAELNPEWALVKNEAMIIAPRALSAHLHLNRRSFLHSYDPNGDPDGQLLESIMTAPVVVAHMINMQYYFSATDPEHLGAGNKSIHNIVSQIGVMEGNFSDLKTGLPWQSVGTQDRLVHEPRRLAVFIYAPRTRVDAIIARHPLLQSLVYGQWIYVHVIEPA